MTVPTLARKEPPTVSVFTENHEKNLAIRATLEATGGRPRAYSNEAVTPLDIRVGDTVRFHGLRTRGPIRCKVLTTTNNYVACALPSGRYTIISWRDGWRGPHGSYGHGMTTDEECRAALDALEKGDIDMSHRGSVYLDIHSVERDGDVIFLDTAEAEPGQPA